jgi:hypothetical protein
MKKLILLHILIAICFISQPVFSQTANDTASLGMAGDNLDLYAVLNLFQKSKTIEGFEKSLNEEKTKINNLDLNLDKKVDFIKVVTTQKDSSFTFILRVAVSKTDSQDVAIILLSKNKGKINLQIVGDEDLYGKDYVIEPSPDGTPSITANPAYEGPDPVVVNVPATQTIVVQSAPIVQYVYSPAYVPYYPPYYYGYYPPYFAAFTVMAVGIYRHNNYYHHHGYHGGHYGGGNTVIINNGDRVNHYKNNDRSRSNTVSDNRAKGNYGNGNGNRASQRPSNSGGNRLSGGASASTRPSTGGGNRLSGGASASTRPSTTPSNRGNSASTRPTTSSRPSTSNYSSRSSSYGGGGGGRSMSGSRGGGGGRRR